MHRPKVKHLKKSVTLWESVTPWGVTLWGHATEIIAAILSTV